MAQTRFLGELESKMFSLDVFNIVVPTLLKLKMNMDVDLLEKSVLHVISVQPNLRSGVEHLNNKLKFKPLKEIRDVFEVLPSRYNWKDVCLQYSKSPLREDAETCCPLKVFFIPTEPTSAYLIPVYLHRVGDGTNGMTIVNDILQSYMCLRKGESLPYNTFDPPPSVEDMSSSEAGEQNESLKQRFVKYHLDNYTKCNCAMPVDEFPANEALYYISSTTVYDEFLVTCRRNQITVGVALIAAHFFGYAAFMYSNTDITVPELVLGCNVPVNLRRRVSKDVPYNCVNFSVTQMVITLGISKEISFWEFACRVKKEMDEKMSSEFKFHLFNAYMEEITKSEIAKTVVEATGKDHQLCVSNMKRYPASVDYGEFCIESIHCVGGLWITGWDVMELMIYSTNKFNLSMIYNHGESNAKRAGAVFSCIQHIVESLPNFKDDFTVEKCMHDCSQSLKVL